MLLCTRHASTSPLRPMYPATRARQRRSAGERAGRPPGMASRSREAVHRVDVAAGHPERGVVRADGFLVGPVEQAVHLAVGVVVQLDLAYAELVGLLVAGVLGD